MSFPRKKRKGVVRQYTIDYLKTRVYTSISYPNLLVDGQIFDDTLLNPIKDVDNGWRDSEKLYNIRISNQRRSSPKIHKQVLLSLKIHPWCEESHVIRCKSGRDWNSPTSFFFLTRPFFLVSTLVDLTSQRQIL